MFRRITPPASAQKMKNNDILISAINLYLARAGEIRLNAAYGGQYHDNGASNMVELAEAYLAGINGGIPEWLKPYIKKAEMQKDPEFEAYERLKKKFEQK